MASLLPGYEYDVFISYRLKDNKHDGWVTDFVNNLKWELESTFKEEISVYFDENPQDGLLETHDVEASLKDKLKCLIFIPVISRTYCDPKSFAWEHEFKIFIELASQDQFGIKVKLPTGNIASRVLPIQIHELDYDDKILLEKELSSVLRGIEFIYKESGVNRPLTNYDDEKKNLNGTRYRNQINKVANAIKDIFAGIKGVTKKSVPGQIDVPAPEYQRIIQEKSIIVLPFENLSPDPDQEYFSDGLTEEIITDLTHVHDLLVISRSSAMTFKGTKKNIREIASDVNVRYILEGSVRKSGNDLRITAQLLDGASDVHLWAEKYTGTLDNIFDIQEKVSGSIVSALKIKLSHDEEIKIHERPIDNVLAYDCYLRASREIMSFSKERLELALNLLQNGIDFTGENAVIYSGIAFTYFQYANLGIEQENNIRKAEDWVRKALELDSGSAEAYFVSACINLTFKGQTLKAIDHYHRADSIKPDNPEIMTWLAFGYELTGKTDEAMIIVERLIKIDPINPLNSGMRGFVYFFKGRFDIAREPMLDLYRLSPEVSMWQFWKSIVLLYNDCSDEAFQFINEHVKEPGQDTIARLTILLKYVLKGDKKSLPGLLTSDLVEALRIDCQLSWHISTFYSYLNDKDQSLEWLENAVNRGFINYPMLNDYDKLLKNVRDEERFKKLMKRVKHEWENFKV